MAADWTQSVKQSVQFTHLLQLPVDLQYPHVRLRGSTLHQLVLGSAQAHQCVNTNKYQRSALCVSIVTYDRDTHSSAKSVSVSVNQGYEPFRSPSGVWECS